MESILSISQQGHFGSALGPTDQGLTGQDHGALHVGQGHKTGAVGGHTCQTSDWYIL